MTTSGADPRFMGLLLSLQQSAWVYLGKVANPGSGKLERNLDAAKDSIDLLEVLEKKTNGNLAAQETKLLSSLLLELRMNYVDELGKSQAEEKSEEVSGAAPAKKTDASPTAAPHRPSPEKPQTEPAE